MNHVRDLWHIFRIRTSRPGNNILIFCKAVAFLLAISLTYESSRRAKQGDPAQFFSPPARIALSCVTRFARSRAGQLDKTSEKKVISVVCEIKRILSRCTKMLLNNQRKPSERKETGWLSLGKVVRIRNPGERVLPSITTDA